MTIEGTPISSIGQGDRTGGDPDTSNRPDLELICDLITPGARVLDIGCGNGELLELLIKRKSADARGLELKQSGVNACVARGLSVIQGDADTDLRDYPDHAFDFVILSLTVQATHHPKLVIEQILRIGRWGIVSLPNFGHWRMRYLLNFTGRMPRTEALPSTWYETQNLHMCTFRDFVDLIDETGHTIEAAWTMSGKGLIKSVSPRSPLPNLFGEQAIFQLKSGRNHGN